MGYCMDPFVRQSLSVPNPPTLQVILPRFSNTYLLWKDPEPFVGAILGVQIRYLINCTPQDIPELGSGIRQYTVPGIKNSAGKTHSISLRARTSAGCGSFSAPVEFTFQPIGKVLTEHLRHESVLLSPASCLQLLCGQKVCSSRVSIISTPHLEKHFILLLTAKY